jgi:hydrogenase-4 component B
MGPEDPGAGGRRPAGAVGRAGRRLLRQGLRHHLPRPAALAAAARARGRPLLARRDVRPRALCLLGGILPGFVIDGWRRRRSLVGARMPVQRRRGCRSCRSPRAAAPTTACWSSSSSRLGLARGLVIHRFASHALRRGPAWDCGFPDPARRPSTPPAASPSRSAASSAPSCSAPARPSTCRRRATLAPARFEVAHARSRLGRLYAPIAGVVGFAAERLNRLQFLTIRAI